MQFDITFRDLLRRAALFRELNRSSWQLEKPHSVSVSLETDDEGYFDLQCPKTECEFFFKVHFEDWEEKVEDKAVCPFCGHLADLIEWLTPKQLDHVSSITAEYVGKHVIQALKRDADKWNRAQPRNSFIKMTMRVEGRPSQVSLPPAAAAPMQLKIECSECACRYAVIGAAFFCPVCGNSDAEVVFQQALSGIRGSVGTLRDIRLAIDDPDTAENTARLIMESGLQSIVTAFQRYAEALYARLEPQATPRRNVFQSISSGSKLWFSATGKCYSNYLTSAEMATLKRAFQRRHLLAHTQGIVDQNYIDLSGDSSHKIGERLVIDEDGVLRFLEVVEKLADNLRVEAEAKFLSG